MNQVNLTVLFAFVVIVIASLLVLLLIDTYKNRPAYRIKTRLFELTHHHRSAVNVKIVAELRRAQNEARKRRLRQSMGRVGYYLNRLDTVAGTGAVRVFMLIAGGVVLVGGLLLLLGVVRVSVVTVLLALVVAPVLVVFVIYNYLVKRFNTHFIHQLPDALDSIVRASQAGVPVSQSIRDVGSQFTSPLGPEFKRMGDAMLLGHELEEVLNEGVHRIELSDFSFFAVCVLLQRESGGSIVEALENLSSIIRARRDLGLKAKALTAEGRLSGLFIAIIPFAILAMLYFVNEEYVIVLFTTETGQLMLWVAAGMLTVGLLAIRHLTNLKV